LEYESAADIIATAAVECGLGTVADPFSSTLDEQIQLRTLLNQCGRELYASYQWQQLVASESIDTGSSPVADGEYDLPDDFGYMINQTGWTPTSAGLGLPLGGPLTRQQWAYLIGTGLSSSTIYVSFNINAGVLQVLPAPAPADTEITFDYVSSHWATNAAGSTGKTKCTAADDIVKFEPILMSLMLAMRYKQAKGFDASALQARFEHQFSVHTGVNTAAPVLNMAGKLGFPYLNPWTNVPQSGFGE
jgi:hypothetical protein